MHGDCSGNNTGDFQPWHSIEKHNLLPLLLFYVITYTQLTFCTHVSISSTVGKASGSYSYCKQVNWDDEL